MSQIIKQLRFPLMVLVVLLHSGVSNIEIEGKEIVAGNLYPIYGFIYYFLSDGITRIAVPLFFLMSGYLFFANISSFDKSTYVKKVKSRTRSLLFPYMLWTILTFILLCVTKRDALQEYISLPIWEAVRNALMGHKLNYHLWFLRDLYLVVLLTPIIYTITKYAKWVFPLGMISLWLIDMVPNVLGLNSQTLIFFCCGSYIGIAKPTILISSEKCRQLTVWGG